MNTSAVISSASRIDASLNQRFLSGLDRGEVEGAFGNRHILAHGWRVRGAVNVDALRRALDDVVHRHEALRTSIDRDDAGEYQLVHPPTGVELLVRELALPGDMSREARAEEFLNELDADVFSVRRLPHLRAVLGRFDETDSVLAILAHHTASDPWSMGIIAQDLAACYANRTGAGPIELPAVPQYREFAEWQLDAAGSESTLASRAYWRDKLAGAEILAIPVDRPRRPGVPNMYANHRFLIDADHGAAVAQLARATRSSRFIVMLAAYKLLSRRLTGADDLVIPTFTAGRESERFHRTVGLFINFLPIRTELGGCETIREAIERTRVSCLEAYAHDIPFVLIAADSPRLTHRFASPAHTVAAFEMLQSVSTMEDTRVGDLAYSEIRRRVRSQRLSSHIPDGALWAMDVLPSGEIVGSLKYDSNLLDEQTAADLAGQFQDVLRTMTSTPDLPLTKL